jgi:dTDP-4-amino-4,6-dideoxygalactose transaminase
MSDRFIDCIFKADRSESELAKLVADIARASRLSGDCDLIAEYETALAAHFGTKHAIAVSSGTAALHASLAEVINPGDEVLLPVIGVPMTATAILQAGGVPVFYDCSPGSFVPDIESLVKYSSSRSKALITVPMWGYPGIDADTLDFAARLGLTVIEDTAQSLGTKRDGRFEGTFGHIGCFSTHEFKLMSTGEGGFILTDDDRLNSRIREFTRIGFSMDPIGFGHRSGLNYKLPALQASLGMSQLQALEEKIDARAAKTEAWRDALRIGSAGALLTDFCSELFEHNGYSLALTLKNAAPGLAKEVAKRLFEQGLNTDIHRYQQSYLVNFPMLHKYYGDKRYSGNCRTDFPNATTVIDSLVVLPLHDQITASDIRLGAERLRSIL